MSNSPSDGLTDVKSGNLKTRGAKIPDGIGPLEDWRRYTDDGRPGSSEVSIRSQTKEVAAKEPSNPLDRTIFGMLGGKLQHSLNVDHKLTVDMQGWGGISRPLHIDHRGMPSPITDPSIRHADRVIEEKYPFKGTYQCQLDNGRLLIPTQYLEALQYGGVITAGMGKYLMLFGKFHWERMVKIMGEQVGLNIDKNILVKHIYGRHQKFEVLYENADTKKQNPFMLLHKDLMDYAKLHKDIVAVGVMYHAEIYSPEAYKESLLDPLEAAKHTRTLSQA